MNGKQHSNGHTPHEEDERSSVNPYLDLMSGSQPPEITEYELTSDPYSNMLPGISSIRAAKTVSHGVELGRRGNPVILAISCVLLVVILLPIILGVITHLVR